MDKKPRFYAGIDTGNNGGLYVIDSEGTPVLRSLIPKKKLYAHKKLSGMKNKMVVDYPALRKVIDSFEEFSNDIVVGLEDVHSLYGMSAKSNFSFGLIKGVKMGILESSPYTYYLITPKKWQAEIWQPQDYVRDDKGKNITKETALKAAYRIYGDIDFTGSLRARKPHDGIVDAALIAEYCRRIYNN